jgi:hypothetical protein
MASRLRLTTKTLPWGHNEATRVSLALGEYEGVELRWGGAPKAESSLFFPGGPGGLTSQGV